MSYTFERLFKTTGKVLFVTGLVLNICMVFFGIWPTPVYFLLMLFGAGMIYLTKKTKTPGITYAAVKKTITLILLSCLCIFSIIILVFIFSKNYFKKQDTLKECEEINIALKHYKGSTDLYPANLFILIQGNPLRSDWMQDEWDKSYKYQLMNGGNSYLLKSSGADQKFGTKDDVIFKGN